MSRSAQSIDYRTLLVEQTPEGDDYRTAERILATRIPDLCPDCEGSGQIDYLDKQLIGRPMLPCTHPNAPTIAKVLAVGHVMLEANGDLSRFADPTLLPADHVKVINSMLAYIIEVDPSRLAALRTEADR